MDCALEGTLDGVCDLGPLYAARDLELRDTEPREGAFDIVAFVTIIDTVADGAPDFTGPLEGLTEGRGDFVGGCDAIATEDEDGCTPFRILRVTDRRSNAGSGQFGVCESFSSGQR